MKVVEKICERLFEALDSLSTLISLLPDLRECEECLLKLQEEFGKRCKQ